MYVCILCCQINSNNDDGATTSNGNAIAGGVIGSIVFLGLVGVALYFMFRKRPNTFDDNYHNATNQGVVPIASASAYVYDNRAPVQPSIYVVPEYNSSYNPPSHQIQTVTVVASPMQPL